jgi:2,3-bisphosphoglycerate-dependent phosphoglycerate mutase
MELLIIRHGLPLRVERTDGGAADPELAAHGHAQSACLAKWLAHEPIAAIYASPMRRAQQTAEPLAAKLGLSIVTEPRIAEWDRSSSEYIPLEELKVTDEAAYRALMKGEVETSINIFDFQKEVVAAAEEIITRHKGQLVAMVCHGGVINTYAASVLGLDNAFGFFQPTYTSINRFRAASNGPRSVLSLNEVGHLHGTELLYR